MKYKQGQNPNSWFKHGHTLSEESKKKIGDALRNRKHPEKSGTNSYNWNSFLKKCAECSKEFYVQNNILKLGKGRYCSRKCSNKAFSKNPSKGMLGKKHTEESRKKISEELKGRIKPPNAYSFPKGKLHPFWKGGITSLNQIIRHSLEYKLWRESVFKRDNWTCVWCKIRGAKLNADHIKPFYLYPELRFAIDNGRTLCVECHRKTDPLGRPKINHKK